MERTWGPCRTFFNTHSPTTLECWPYAPPYEVPEHYLFRYLIITNIVHSIPATLIFTTCLMSGR